MIKRIVGWIVLVPLCAVLVIFALANRHAVPVRFDPISADSPFLPGAEVPLFVVIYCMLLAGIVLGGFAMWFAQGRNRRERRQFKREAERLARALEADKRARATSQGALDGPDDFLDD
jgi:uncharacterized integral membrane protein